MTSLIVISFTNEAQAIEASHKLAELEAFGDITVYEKVIVKRDVHGNTTVIQTETTDGPGVAASVGISTMVGALAGPVGLLGGMATGTIIGAAAESDNHGFSENFTAKLSKELKPGSVAILAELTEDNPSVADNALSSFGGSIYRPDIDDMYNGYVDDQMEQLSEKMAAQRARLKSSVATNKARIQQKIAQLKEKRRKRIAELKLKHQSAVENKKMGNKKN